MVTLINAITPISVYNTCKLHQRNHCWPTVQSFNASTRRHGVGCMRRPMHCWCYCPTVGLYFIAHGALARNACSDAR